MRLGARHAAVQFQIHATVHHSLGAIGACKAGVFAPPSPVPALDFAGLQKQVSEAREALQKLKPTRSMGRRARTWSSRCRQ